MGVSKNKGTGNQSSTRRPNDLYKKGKTEGTHRGRDPRTKRNDRKGCYLVHKPVTLRTEKSNRYRETSDGSQGIDTEDRHGRTDINKSAP